MSDPIETVAEALNQKVGFRWSDNPEAYRRAEARNVLASLSRHWDGLWDVIAEVRDASPRWPTDADTGDIVDAVLNYLTGDSA